MIIYTHTIEYMRWLLVSLISFQGVGGHMSNTNETISLIFQAGMFLISFLMLIILLIDKITRKNR